MPGSLRLLRLDAVFAAGEDRIREASEEIDNDVYYFGGILKLRALADAAIR